MLRGLFVTGTDTGVGKTVVAASIVAALSARGIAVRPLKPIITGLEAPADPVWPRDHELLAAVSGVPSNEVALVRYGPPVSPHLAAALDGEALDARGLARAIVDRARPDELLIVEGAGGLLVPISDDYDMRSLAHELGLRVVIAARPGLGTINHTLLTVEAARRGGLHVAGVVLTPWPTRPSLIEKSNRATISRLSELEVSVLPEVRRPDAEELAEAGRALPVERWLP